MFTVPRGSLMSFGGGLPRCKKVPKTLHYALLIDAKTRREVMWTERLVGVGCVGGGLSEQVGRNP
jgi:hypothetical protein